MRTHLRLDRALPGDLSKIHTLVPEIGPDRLADMIADGCFVVLRDRAARLQAAGGFDLDLAELTGIGFRNRTHSQLHQLLEGIERRAVRFGLTHLSIPDHSPMAPFAEEFGYRTARNRAKVATEGRQRPRIRSLARRKTALQRSIEASMESLGVPGNYGQTHRMAIVEEARTLGSIGRDIYGREQWMLPAAADRWRDMCAACRTEGIEMLAVSAFRSHDYQFDIVRRKLERGQHIDQILEVSAPPGFSEHHSGRAIDVTQSGFSPLEEEFERSPAFSWLCNQAIHFGFSMTYPRGNRHGVIYEPWHWAWQPT